MLNRNIRDMVGVRETTRLQIEDLTRKLGSIEHEIVHSLMADERSDLFTVNWRRLNRELWQDSKNRERKVA